KVPEASLQRHIDLCEWKSRGLSEEEKQKELPSSAFAYQNIRGIKTFFLNTESQHNILSEASRRGEISSSLVTVAKPVPATPDRSITELGPLERRAIYDALVERAKQGTSVDPSVLEELQIDWSHKPDSDNKPKSAEELLAAQRDY